MTEARRRQLTEPNRGSELEALAAADRAGPGVGAEGAPAAGCDCWVRGGAGSVRCRRPVMPRRPSGSREAELRGVSSCRRLV